MMQNDTEYYALREQQERARAERASDAAARDVHLALAARYAELTRSASPVTQAA